MAWKRSAAGLLAIGLLALGSAQAADASADNYPQRPIKLIVPFPPGGGTDMFGRVVAQQLEKDTGWSMVVENRPGAGGSIGVQSAVQSAPDGYTIVLGQTSNLAINPTLYKNLQYSPPKDLAPIVLVADSPVAVAVSADSPYHSIGEVVDALKQKPGSLSLGFSGNGTVSHLVGAYLESEAGVKFTMVPYKGAANAMTDLMGGRIDLYMSSVPTLLGYMRDKKLRGIGVTSSERIAVMPDTPSLQETKGLEDFVGITWFGLLAPAGTPDAIIQKLNAAVNKTLQNPAVRDKFAEEGSRALGGTSADFRQLIVKDTAMWAKVIKDASIETN